MKILNRVKSAFTQKHPIPRYIYAITAGAYLGELLVYIDSTSDDHNFLILPNMKTKTIPKSKFDIGMDSNIVDVVEKLPSYVYKTCILQYSKEKTCITKQNN
jgi:hypothetical protein